MDSISEETTEGDFVLHRENPQQVLALNLINTLGVKEALHFAQERQWQGVITQIYRNV